ncbi:hypothetical protein [Poritiphilus flavus]|uniref:Uncharacterized protein n=1 Tax=Poritiphilus flavus TaxID=2697053 RepID=A0A6L9EGN8_9FLAO|nr:hypothetical protein [Poritiphilus flavus]NAS13970.1 hypothetical protein [Poritiphilus flavus]
MIYRIFIAFIFISTFGFSQEASIPWESDYQIQLEDFKASTTQINKDLSNISVHSGVMIDFGFQMSNVAFMFTKNFNSKVSCNFHRNAASLMAPDSLKAQQLVKLVRFDFDLSELYARKIRRELYENKKAFSDPRFFQPYFDKLIAERNEISSRVYSASDFGNKSEVLQQEHQAIKTEIEALADYCKLCKPPKKRKKKK